MERRAVIYGAGKIGRGFAAELLLDAGRTPVFADASRELVGLLNRNAAYTLRKLASEAEQTERLVSGYEALAADDGRLPELLAGSGLLFACVYPAAFGDLAGLIVDALRLKAERGDRSPLEAVVLANQVGAGEALKEAVRRRLTGNEETFAEGVLRIRGAAVIRVATDPGEELRRRDALAVVTDGYPVLHVEGERAGGLAEAPGIRFHENFSHVETGKVYTYNMAHAAAAFFGAAGGYGTVAEALADPGIGAAVEGALEESCAALVLAYPDLHDFLDGLPRRVLLKFKNPLLSDSVARVGADPARKLSREDRVIGPAMLARSLGIYPLFLYKAAGYGYRFRPEGDRKAAEIGEEIAKNGIDSAIRKVSGLREADAVCAIRESFAEAAGGFSGEDPDRAALLKKAYALGFAAEKRFKGCAQCALHALGELTGSTDPAVFKAATAFSGGIALCGDGVCGGYAGGAMFMSLVRGRSLERMPVDGDKENQYAAYGMAQRLHDRFIACYGSPICTDIHVGMFETGERYVLRTKERRTEFEAAGAHAHVCTTVVALAAAWTADILYGEKLLDAGGRLL